MLGAFASVAEKVVEKMGNAITLGTCIVHTSWVCLGGSACPRLDQPGIGPKKGAQRPNFDNIMLFEVPAPSCLSREGLEDLRPQLLGLGHRFEFQ